MKWLEIKMDNETLMRENGERVERIRLKGILNAIVKSWDFNQEVSGSQCLSSMKRK